MTDRAGSLLGWVRPGSGNGLRFAAAMVLVGAFVQVTLMPRIRIGALDATPNLVVAIVVAIGALRGVVVGAVSGFTAGMLVELLTPGETLGVLALAYVVIGAYCGRYAGGATPIGRWFNVAVVAVAAGLVPAWFATVELLQGEGPPLGFLLTRLVFPQMILAPFVALPVWWVARRLLGAPREVEPWVVAA